MIFIYIRDDLIYKIYVHNKRYSRIKKLITIRKLNIHVKNISNFHIMNSKSYSSYSIHPKLREFFIAHSFGTRELSFECTGIAKITCQITMVD